MLPHIRPLYSRWIWAVETVLRTALAGVGFKEFFCFPAGRKRVGVTAAECR